MRAHELISTPKKTGKRVGRGISAGQGKTCGRGTKGQKSRTGANSNIPRTFEGAATGLIQRLPKLKGFKSHRVKPVQVSYDRLEAVFDDKSTITMIDLVENGLVDVDEVEKGIKIVGGKGKSKKTFSFDKDDSNLILTKKVQE